MNTVIQIQMKPQSWPITGGFRISRGAKTHAEVLVVTLTDEQNLQGRGECVPYARYGETMQSVQAQIENMRNRLSDQAGLQNDLPAGAARNALDCALWDLQCQQRDQAVWQMAGQSSFTPSITAFTLSLDSPKRMAEAAKTAHA
ncbi:L-alanine-DL-glutamate epimerase (EC 5.1.1.n1), partial [hydrothermal vent metagenome]